MIYSVIDYLIRSYTCYADKEAIVYNGRTTTYRQLYEAVRKTAGWIQEHIQVCRKPVVVMMGNSDKAVTAFLGIALSGNIYVPLDADMPPERLKIILEVLRPECIITDEKNEQAEKAACQVISLNEILTMPDTEMFLANTGIIDTDPLYIMFTSGSTGTPKGVAISNRSVIDFTEEASEAMEFSKDEIFLNQAPFYFDASVPDIYCTLRNGATLHIVDKSIFTFPVKLMDYISIHKINAIFWVPSALIMVANLKALGKSDISCLKKIMFCGEVMPVKQLNMWMDAVPAAKFVNYYGPCEATYACSYYVVERRFESHEPLPIGKAARNTAIMIIHNGKEIKTAGEQGEIYIRGSGVGLGYYNNPERTKENFIQNPLQQSFPEIVYKTGDLAHYDPAGNIIYDGRADFQIKKMGYRVELGEIETAVSSLEEISVNCCLFDDKRKKIILFMKERIELSEINKKIEGIIPAYMLPDELIWLDEMPYNQNGKIDRLKLKEMLENRGVIR